MLDMIQLKPASLASLGLLDLVLRAFGVYCPMNIQHIQTALCFFLFPIPQDSGFGMFWHDIYARMSMISARTGPFQP